MQTQTQAAPQVHEWTGPTGVNFRDVAEPSGTYYRDTTPREVINALELARKSGARVRLFLGDKETGRDWCEEYDVTGTIGRSTGPVKIPLLIASRRSHGGGAILTDCIIRLLIDGREVYRHPKYHAPEFVTRLIDPPSDGYAACVLANGKECAQFKTLAAAFRWVAFMRGERMSK
jgi:hypothetical protein